ncbi:MAG TPA: hypothetical protein VD741_09160, partial [Solirubrobacterales bacterium]|nr:hypothetical protein [Solirubrobacterales bacterium]
MISAGRLLAGRALALLAISVASLSISVSAAEAAPTNDAFTAATALSPTPPIVKEGDTFGAGKESGEPNHAGSPGGHSVWYSWTPSSSGPVSVQAGSCFGGFEAAVGVYTGASVDALTPVASNASPFPVDCFFSERPQAEWQAVAGTTYWIAVDGKDGSEGTFTLELSGPPANDDFAAAESLPSGASHNVFATTRLSDKETGEPSHAGDPGGHSVWFNWTPTASERVRIFTCTTSSRLDALLAVYTGSQLDLLTEVAGNDEAPSPYSSGGCRGTDSAVSIDAVAGTTYRIAVDGANGTSGRFNLRIEGRPGNDSFDSPRHLMSILPIGSQGNNGEATKEVGEPDHAGATGGQSVWFEWIAPTSGRVRITTCSHGQFNLDTVLGVYTGSTLGGLTQVAASDDGPRPWCRGRNSEVELNTVSGTAYKIAVDSKGSQGEFGVSIEAPGANDAF